MRVHGVAGAIIALTADEPADAKPDDRVAVVMAELQVRVDEHGSIEAVKAAILASFAERLDRSFAEYTELEPKLGGIIESLTPQPVNFVEGPGFRMALDEDIVIV